eukprot:TRINITY_DN8452_c0_g1_i8.p1 TRINITY_DN8452_c0_g1~~TRINITY_DN8452_c0_g1_i8.p1  ORF type:complete len:151 (-),score=37.34 TRINITY_DN8452_c0_g1_i8:195-647(-)
MIRRPPRSTQGVSSAASDVYKRQVSTQSTWEIMETKKLIIGGAVALGLAALGVAGYFLHKKCGCCKKTEEKDSKKEEKGSTEEDPKDKKESEIDQGRQMESEMINLLTKLIFTLKQVIPQLQYRLLSQIQSIEIQGVHTLVESRDSVVQY